MNRFTFLRQRALPVRDAALRRRSGDAVEEPRRRFASSTHGCVGIATESCGSLRLMLDCDIVCVAMRLAGARARGLRIIALVAVLGACAEPDTPEEQVRALVSAVQTAANESDVGTLRSFVAASYRDSRGNTKDEIDRMIGLQLLRGRPYVLLRLRDLSIDDAMHAEIQMLAGMARVPVGGFDELRKAAADIYVFDLTLLDEGGGEWRVISAQWRFAGPDDLMW
jgi:hypothetical protein